MTRADSLADPSLHDGQVLTQPRWAQYPEDGTLPIAPEICVEIQSPSNTDREMSEKTALYLQAGAHEVWIVKLDGTRRVCR